MSNSLIKILRQHALSHPNSLMISHLESGSNFTYQQTLEITLKLAAVLDQLKIEKKDRVVLAAKNYWLVYPLLIACSTREATLVPIDPELHRDELTSILKHASPALTITADSMTLPPITDSIKSTHLTLSELIHLTELIDPIETPHPMDQVEKTSSRQFDEAALIIYTSGTTGGAKAVKLSQKNLIANATSLAKRYQVARDDRFFCVLPTHHMNALMMTGMVPLVAGAQIYLSEVLSFKNAKLFWKNLARHQITICSLVPSIMALLLKLFPKGADTSLTQLRYGFCGAAPLPESTWKSFEAVFDFPIYQGYGLTETTCWVTSTPPGQHSKTGVGTPLDCEVIIDAPPTQEVESDLFHPTSVVQAGEVLIRGPVVTSGYFRNQKLTSETLTDDGFFKTGDLGFFDSKAQLVICGRLKDIIIKNGSNIFPGDLEKELCRHPAVRECKVVGIPDKLVGERIYAICVLRENSSTTELDLRTWLQDKISKQSYPDAILIHGYLPSGATGKTSTGLLRKIITGELSEEIATSLQSRQVLRSPILEPLAIRQILQHSLTSSQPVQFLAYWGCGKRDSISEVDRQTLLKLIELTHRVRRVKQVVPKLTLIFTDQHARNNRIPEDRQQYYFGAVAEYAQKLGVKTIFLSELWASAGLTHDQILKKRREPEFESLWFELPHREALILQARKHFEHEGDPEEAAKLYYLHCRAEAPIVRQQYPQSIFTTYNSSSFDFLLPDLPKLHIYSFKHGTSVKPWFVGKPVNADAPTQNLL